MPRRDERKGSEFNSDTQPEVKATLDPELDALLREARETLEENEVPSGGWEVTLDLPQAPVADSWPRDSLSIPGGLSLDGIDPETAFWLLFPPRGNA